MKISLLLLSLKKKESSWLYFSTVFWVHRLPLHLCYMLLALAAKEEYNINEEFTSDNINFSAKQQKTIVFNEKLKCSWMITGSALLAYMTYHAIFFEIPSSRQRTVNRKFLASRSENCCTVEKSEVYKAKLHFPLLFPALL